MAAFLIYKALTLNFSRLNEQTLMDFWEKILFYAKYLIEVLFRCMFK
jgi:hypothetical protein